MISLKTLEKDINEIVEHLSYFKKSFDIKADLNLFTKQLNLSNSNFIDEEIINVHLVLAISQLDLSLILKGVHYSNTNCETRHLLKRGFLIIFETFETLNKLSKPLRSYSTQNPQLEIEFKQLTKFIRDFKMLIENETRIKKFRNNIAAHINSNFMDYYNLTNEIKPDSDIDLFIRFRLLLNDINVYIFKCFCSHNN